MKSIIPKIKIILIALALLISLNWANAAFQSRPTNCTPPNCDAPRFLNTGPEIQSIGGHLTIIQPLPGVFNAGSANTSAYRGKLNVEGSLSADSMVVSGMTVITGHTTFNNLYFKVGPAFNGSPGSLCINSTTKQVVKC